MKHSDSDLDREKTPENFENSKFENCESKVIFGSYNVITVYDWRPCDGNTAMGFL